MGQRGQAGHVHRGHMFVPLAPLQLTQTPPPCSCAPPLQ